MAGIGTVVCVGQAGRDGGDGRPRGAGGAEYFPGMPEGFPGREDFRVMRALIDMARVLHGWPEFSRRRPGHQLRLCRHGLRIREELGRRKAEVVS